MSNWKTNLVLAVLVPLAGCGGNALKDFADAELQLDASQEGLVRVTLGDTHGGCKSLGGALRARLNGVNLTVDGLGGEVKTASGWTCARPTFSVPRLAVAAMGAQAQLELSDGETTITLEAGGVFGDRALTPARPAQAAGDEKAWRFLWRPLSDQSRRATWRLQTEGTPPLFGEAEVEGDSVRVELPEGASGGTLTVDGSATAQVSRCEGVAACSVRVRNSSGELRLGALF